MRKYDHIDTSIIKYSFIFWRILVPLIVSAFIIRQVYLFIQYKKVYPFKILTVSAAFIVYYLFGNHPVCEGFSVNQLKNVI
jgi:hypothetical protein